MIDDDALLKLTLVRIQLERMHERGEVTPTEFEAACRTINQEEQNLVDELRRHADSASQVDRQFLDALKKLKVESKLPQELAERLLRSYSHETAELRSVQKGPEVPVEQEKPEEEAVAELEPPVSVEVAGPVADGATTPYLEAEIEEQIPADEEEIERHGDVSKVLSAFLQERNIRWGEIIAALMRLYSVCAIGWTISAFIRLPLL